MQPPAAPLMTSCNRRAASSTLTLSPKRRFRLILGADDGCAFAARQSVLHCETNGDSAGIFMRPDMRNGRDQDRAARNSPAGAGLHGGIAAAVCGPELEAFAGL